MCVCVCLWACAFVDVMEKADTRIGVLAGKRTLFVAGQRVKSLLFNTFYVVRRN